MSTELEDEIRTALRESAESVTRDRLHYADGPRDRVRRRAPLYAAIAAAVVVAIAVGASFWTANRGTTPAGGHSLRLAGNYWRLVSVTDSHGTVAIPNSPPADLMFYPDGTFAATDGGNVYTGDYRSTPTSIALSHVIGSGAGYVGSNPVVLARIAAVGAMTTGDEVAVTRHGDHLTLHAGSYTLQYKYGGSAEKSTPTASAPASSTSSP
ncbi:MAG TPA: hypothetical protein VFL65_08055 [Jatrophihabitans sp.]|nr:hypothetical protein [Jatrophihabitans sp.]